MAAGGALLFSASPVFVIFFFCSHQMQNMHAEKQGKNHNNCSNGHKWEVVVVAGTEAKRRNLIGSLHLQRQQKESHPQPHPGLKLKPAKKSRAKSHAPLGQAQTRRQQQQQANRERRTDADATWCLLVIKLVLKRIHSQPFSNIRHGCKINRATQPSQRSSNQQLPTG